MILLFAIFLGLFINYIYGGTEFNSLICMFAGIFLIMPFLLKIKIKELFIINKKEYIYKNLLLNFGVNILLFIGIPLLFFGTSDIIYGFLLLGLLSGGGLVLSWINKSGGDTKLGFQLFIINFIIFNILFLPLSYNIEQKEINNNVPANSYSITTKTETPLIYKIDYDNNKEKEQNTCVVSELTGNTFSCFTSSGGISPFFSFFILIILPFIISRIILISNKISGFLLKYIKNISNIATFLLITYIFTLKDLHGLLVTDLYNIFLIGASTLIIYIFLYGINMYIYSLSKKNTQDLALFWLSTTRFITLGLIFSFIYSFYLGIEIIYIFIFAYIYQILFSILFSSFFKTEK